MEGDAVVGRVHQLNVGGRQQALGKVAAAVAVGRLAQVEPAEVQQVEAVEYRRRVAFGRRDFARRLQLDAVLQRVERRPAGCVERQHLAVENHPAARLRGQFGGDLRKGRRQVETAAGTQPHLAVAHEGEDPIAVELGLEHPVRVGEGGVGQFGQHRREPRRHRLDAALRGQA
jgi:hypothetical protein